MVTSESFVIKLCSSVGRLECKEFSIFFFLLIPLLIYSLVWQTSISIHAHSVLDVTDTLWKRAAAFLFCCHGSFWPFPVSSPWLGCWTVPSPVFGPPLFISRSRVGFRKKKCPDSIILGFCRPYSICYNFSALPVWHQSVSMDSAWRSRTHGCVSRKCFCQNREVSWFDHKLQVCGPWLR